jgi:hypothetical protein
MTHHTTRAALWTPCRRHLFETLSAVTPQHRARARWRISADLWERIKADPDLRCDWFEGPRGKVMLGQPVDVTEAGPAFPEIYVRVDCHPGPPDDRP